MTRSLRFLGATGTVTGSRFLVEDDRRRVLVECGLYQGPRELRQRNWDPLPVAAADIDAVVLTHAHLDHTGYLPKLVRDGFDGLAYATPDTVALAGIVLPDSGHLQEEESEYANRKHSSRHRPALALYTEAEALAALEVLRAVPFGSPLDVAGARVSFHPVGHILGSACVLVDLGGHRVLFSGDVGRDSHPLLSPPAPPPAADTVVVESTYGDRRHPPLEDLRDRLAASIVATARRGGTIVIPAFAVDRTEMILFELASLVRADEVPSLPVFVDSPMALRALTTYRAAMAGGSDDLRAMLRCEDDPFEGLDLREARSTEESKALNRVIGPSIIVSASGMASGGRVLHHLARLLPDRRSTVLLVGFQAAGTRGRSLLDGARSVKIFGEYVPVRAHVENLSGFSAHADRDELVRWISAMPAPPAQVFVVHGEPSAAAGLQHALDDVVDGPVVVPSYLERVLLR